ncbi:phosphotransferase family protein [Rhodoligotrophos defluvii]|uniref:phosphotransferase family protein n=1 Tax=Rhodoligotrophos defluvii TaxID=2561934 RepID=UPI0010C97601|nr:phosphotransferase family protein [Rhodoligotrophos defluvii]
MTSSSRVEPIDRQKEFSGVDAVRPAHRFDESRLEAYMADRVEGFRGPITVEQFKGGQSNPTYRITAPSGRYVLRRKPPGKLLPSAHAVDREYRVIAALHPHGFPVARPYVLCNDDSVIGTAFYIMDFVDGRVFWDPAAPGVSPAERGAIYDSLNATIAQLHSFDYTALGLGDFGKAQGYVARQIKRWSEQYKASETRHIPEMDRLMAWLPEACPESTDSALVHGDFRLDNTIIAPDEPRISAVLDWELSTIGDPIADFTYHIMQWRMPPSEINAGVGTLVGHDLSALGIPPIEAYIERYCERTGRSSIPAIDFYLAYNFFRLAAIFQGIVGRVRDGTAANPKAAAMETQVEPMAKVAWAYARAAGA